MSRNLKIRTVILGIILILSVAFLVICFLPKNENPNDTSSGTKISTEYIIKLHENDIVLFENEKIIKYYDINPSVLPGEDLTLLIKGITVNTVAEADKIAEDFDG